MPSFGSVGDAFDKTMMEAFWSRTQIEILSQRRRTRLELTNVVLDNVEVFCNRQRSDSSLAYV
jgi:hypothetical protein